MFIFSLYKNIIFSCNIKVWVSVCVCACVRACVRVCVCVILCKTIMSAIRFTHHDQHKTFKTFNTLNYSHLFWTQNKDNEKIQSCKQMFISNHHRNWKEEEKHKRERKKGKQKEKCALALQLKKDEHSKQNMQFLFQLFLKQNNKNMSVDIVSNCFWGYKHITWWFPPPPPNHFSQTPLFNTEMKQHKQWTTKRLLQ